MKKILSLLLVMFFSLNAVAIADEVAQKMWERAIKKCDVYKDYDSALADIQRDLAYAEKNGFSYSMRALELRILGKQENYELLEKKASELPNYTNNVGSYFKVTAPYYEACAAFAQGKYEKAIEKFKESSKGISNSIFDYSREGMVRSYLALGQTEQAKNILNRMPLYKSESIADIDTYPGKIILRGKDSDFLKYALEAPRYEGLLRY